MISGWNGTEGASTTLTAQLPNLFANDFYLNVHTSAFPSADIRGQIIQADTGGDLIDLSGAGIGSFESLDSVFFNDMMGNTELTTLFNGEVSTLNLQAVSFSDLTAAHFIFATGTGNQTLEGTANDDDLFGADGNDTLLGGDGEDLLFGEDDNDLLNGGAGADFMEGGLGNDIYMIDNAGDIVDETIVGSSGSDRVLSSVTVNFSNTAQIRGALARIELTGTGNINATGNLLANSIVGNSATT